MHADPQPDLRQHPGDTTRHPPASLSHTAPDGSARMVDVSDKPITARAATAEGFVRVSAQLAHAIQTNAIAKGSVLEVARLAGILAAKRTHELIPLCHSLSLDATDVRATLEPPTAPNAPQRVRVVATARTSARTGVEMEALTAVAVACLTIIDMGKAIDKAMVIEGVRVLQKLGGRSGSFVASDAPPAIDTRGPR